MLIIKNVKSVFFNKAIAIIKLVCPLDKAYYST